jgi:hypothetical protein
VGATLGAVVGAAFGAVVGAAIASALPPRLSSRATSVAALPLHLAEEEALVRLGFLKVKPLVPQPAVVQRRVRRLAARAGA